MSQSAAVSRNPWAWVPSLYFAQGIPYVMAVTVSVIMYKRLGVSNTDIALYTSWLYLPWVIKPLWSPIVDLIGTKRLWTVGMQAIIGASLAMVALTIPGPRFFQYTIALFWLMAFASATHDIAADGFYMLGLKQHQQAAFVGVRSTFYRIATIAAQGLLVVLAGYIETSSGLPRVEFNVTATPDAMNRPLVLNQQNPLTPDSERLELITGPNDIQISTVGRKPDEIESILKDAARQNIQNGFYAAEDDSPAAKEQDASWWSRYVATPLGGFLQKHFGDERRSAPLGGGNIGVTALRLSKQPPPGEDIVVLLNRRAGEERIEIVEGSRLVFNDRNWDKPAWVIFKVSPKIRTQAEASFVATSGNIPLAWTIPTAALAVLFIVFCVYHKFALPYPVTDKPARAGRSHRLFADFISTFAAFFRKKNIAAILGFLLLFRFAEAQLAKLVSPFLLDPRDVGGLGLSTGQVGIIYGTFGIVALIGGGLLGGYLISRQGLKFWLWPMVLAIQLPDLAFVYLAYAHPTNEFAITSALAIEQFGYGFGFTAYMLFMIMVAEGEHKTAHYAICTGFMALGMMLPGMVSGWIQEQIGYQHFFVWVMISTIPGFVVTALLKIDPQFGRKQAEPEAAVLPAAPLQQAEMARSSGETET